MRFSDLDAAISVIDGPAEEPVSVAEVRAQLRVDALEEEDLFFDWIRAARELVESDTRRALVTQTLELSLDRFPCGGIELRRPPVQSVVSVKYLDASGVDVTLPAENYELDAAREPGWLTPAWGVAWPVARRQPGSVRVRFVAGYGGAADVPRRAALAIRLLVAHWYIQREAVGSVGPEIEFGYGALVRRLAWGGVVS